MYLGLDLDLEGWMSMCMSDWYVLIPLPLYLLRRKMVDGLFCKSHFYNYYDCCFSRRSL